VTCCLFSADDVKISWKSFCSAILMFIYITFLAD